MKKFIIICSLFIIILLSSIVEAMTVGEYINWYIEIKTKSVMIERIIIEKLEQNKDKEWKHLNDIINIWKG